MEIIKSINYKNNDFTFISKGVLGMVRKSMVDDSDTLSGKLLKNGQITIPNLIRKKYNLNQGDIVFFSISKFVKKDGSIIEGPISENTIDKKQKKLNNLIEKKGRS